MNTPENLGSDDNQPHFNLTEDMWNEFAIQHAHDEPKRSPAEIMNIVTRYDEQVALISVAEATEFIRQCLDGPLLFDLADKIQQRNITRMDNGELPIYMEKYPRDVHPADMKPLVITQVLHHSEPGIGVNTARTLIDEGLEEIVGYSLNKFTGLDASIADRLIDKEAAWCVLLNFDAFDDLNPDEYLVRLLQAEDVDGDILDAFCEKLPGFTELDNDIAAILTQRLGAYWLESLSPEQLIQTFPNLDHTQIAGHIFEYLEDEYESKLASEWLSKLKNIDPKSMMDLAIAHNAGYLLLFYADKFPGIDAYEVINLMINTGDALGVEDTIRDQVFGSFDPADLAELLAENDMIDIIADNIDSFTVLRAETAYDLIRAGHADKVKGSITKFLDLDRSKLQSILDHTISNSN